MTRKLKVGYLLVDPGIDLGGYQGSRIHVEHILAGLRHAGHEVRLVAAQPHGKVLFDQGDRKIQTSELQAGQPHRLTAQLWYLAEQHGFPHPEIVVSDRAFRCAAAVFQGCDLIHARLALFDLAAACLARELNLPLVVEANAPLIEEARLFYPHVFVHHPEALARFAISRTFDRAAAIVAVSEALAKMLATGSGVQADRITVLPNAADPHPRATSEQRIRELRHEHKLGNDDQVVIFVGALQPWHGVESLVQAFAQLSRAESGAKLLIVGDGQERDRLERLTTELSMRHHVRFVGEVPHTRVAELLALADIAVAPYSSLPTAFYFSPLKLFEYMAAGKATVATRTGQVAQMIADGHDGLLTTPGDVGELKMAIELLLADKELRRRLGHNARDKVLREHTWADYVRRLTAVYRQVLMETA